MLQRFPHCRTIGILSHKVPPSADSLEREEMDSDKLVPLGSNLLVESHVSKRKEWTLLMITMLEARSLACTSKCSSGTGDGRAVQAPSNASIRRLDSELRFKSVWLYAGSARKNAVIDSENETAQTKLDN
jgi:hypothetical protein